MSYLSEDKIASIVDRVVARLDGGAGSVPLKSSPAPVNPPFGCQPTSKLDRPGVTSVGVGDRAGDASTGIDVRQLGQRVGTRRIHFGREEEKEEVGEATSWNKVAAIAALQHFSPPPPPKRTRIVRKRKRAPDGERESRSIGRRSITTPMPPFRHIAAEAAATSTSTTTTRTFVSSSS